MSSTMSSAVLAALGGAAVAVVVLLSVGIVLAWVWRARATRAAGVQQAELASARADLTTLQARLEELEAARAATPVTPPVEYLITTAPAAGERRPEPVDVPLRSVVSVSLAEPLLKTVALAYGVRRALSPESRNRIAFEMRREVKRARKQRRRSARQARQAARAAERATLAEDAA